MVMEVEVNGGDATACLDRWTGLLFAQVLLSSCSSSRLPSCVLARELQDASHDGKLNSDGN
jgi:hypothetical protein